MTEEKLNARMLAIKHKILVLSGKGGVGKSTVATHLARSLVKAGQRVGLLDIDLCGPSIPKVLGVQDKSVYMSSDGWVPIYTDPSKTLAIMSIGLLVEDKSQAIIWRGPKKTATIKQFLEDVCWGDLDYLIIDTPPGTSDEHISVCQYLANYNPDGAVIVTTPQKVSIADVRKEISFCTKSQLPILGIVENMSGFCCPCCGEITNIFSSGGGESLATALNIPFIGRIPIDPLLGSAMEDGENFFVKHVDSPSLAPIDGFVSRIVSQNQDSESTSSSVPA
eukprot:TRINITY_DN3123_c2_g1_i1.p1 TRINITY_DN3123_c2_g1~~TRINITY_DN3123_c2_g1_i1.p1  ORF type:complete len:303 (+),score=101.57 TRINITY_DN3123_c2_g1_i1:74-910(+)